MCQGQNFSAVPLETISENAWASFNRRPVPTLDFAAPGPQASLWAPTTMYRSEKQKRATHNHTVFILRQGLISSTDWHPI